MPRDLSRCCLPGPQFPSRRSEAKTRPAQLHNFASTPTVPVERPGLFLPTGSPEAMLHAILRSAGSSPPPAGALAIGQRPFFAPGQCLLDRARVDPDTAFAPQLLGQ